MDNKQETMVSITRWSRDLLTFLLTLALVLGAGTGGWEASRGDTLVSASWPEPRLYTGLLSRFVPCTQVRCGEEGCSTDQERV